jgi:nucleoside 2-deoxyribosyltransferase
MAIGICFLCAGPAEVATANGNAPVSASVECGACGRYRGPLDLLQRLRPPLYGYNRDLELLRCHVRRSPVEVSFTADNWFELADLEGRVTVAEKLDRLIEFVGRKTVPGAFISTFDVDRLIVGVPDQEEWDFLLEHLERTEVVFRDGPNARLTVKGWERYGSAETRSRRCFIAMSFAPELDAAHEAIARAIQACSLVPVRVDLVHHNEKICDRMVAEIKGSGYMVADVTFHRQNVYFEAGLAAGMGRPVIWTCRSDLLEAGHFDTRQYSYVAWSTETDLFQQLKDRILATIPEARPAAFSGDQG